MDFSNLYNTQLDPIQELAYQKWVKEQSAQQGRDIGKDVQDYDLRGFFKNKESLSSNGHGADTYKKPNHPTFSDQSIYNGVNGMQGGNWSNINGVNTFKTSPINTIMYSPEQLQNYFDKVEPDSSIRFQNLKDKLKTY